MRGGRTVPVALLAALVALALAGCAQPDAAGAEAPEGAEDDPGRTARGGGDGDDDGEDPVVVTIGGTSGGVLTPGTYPLTVTVPAGGVRDVEWSMEVVPVSSPVMDGVRGPGCVSYGWYSGVTSSGTSGTCSELPEGTHDFSFVVNAPVASHSVRIQGQLREPPSEAAPGNATGDPTSTSSTTTTTTTTTTTGDPARWTTFATET